MAGGGLLREIDVSGEPVRGIALMLGNFAGAVRIRDVFVVVCDGEGGCLGAMWSAAGDDFVFYGSRMIWLRLAIFAT